jgi:hypothetical protein
MVINFYSTHKYVLWANEWCSVILFYYPRFLLHSWPHIVTLWATIATHLWAKMAENGLKTIFLTMLTFITSYSKTQICSFGQWVMFSYYMVLSKGPTTLKTLYNHRIGHHRWQKTVEKHVFYNVYLCKLLFYSQIWSMVQWVVFSYPMVSPKVLTTLMTPYSYPIGNHSHSFVSKNGQNSWKTCIWRCISPQPLIWLWWPIE